MMHTLLHWGLFIGGMVFMLLIGWCANELADHKHKKKQREQELIDNDWNNREEGEYGD